MHIGFCSPTWPPNEAANGIVSYVATVRDHLIAEGHRVSVISEGAVFFHDGTSESVRCPRRGSPIGRFANRVRRRLKRWDGGLPHIGREVAADVLSAHRIAPLDILEMEESFGWCGIVQRATGVPVVTRLHGPHFLKPERLRDRGEILTDRSRCRAEARAVRSARVLTAPTRAMMAATCEAYERSASRFDAVIPNPIPVGPEGSRWRLEQCEREHILMVGRFDYWKGADTMLAAFERLLEHRPSAKLTLVGPDLGIEIAPGQSIGFEAYSRAVLSSAARQRVRFVGRLRPDQIAELRLTANVTVVASRCENFPYVLLEGFAAGCPMISTDWPGSAEIINHGETGMLTPVGEPEALAKHLDWLLDHPHETAAMGAAGQRRCARDFSVEAAGRQLIDCYKETLATVQRT